MEVVIWADLTPFMAMSEAEAVEALAEYAVYQENFAGAKVSWLRKLINDALRARLTSESEQWAAMILEALLNECAWCSLLDTETIQALGRAVPLEQVRDSIEGMVREGLGVEEIIGAIRDDTSFHMMETLARQMERSLEESRPDLRELIALAGGDVFTSAVRGVRGLIEGGNFSDVLGTNPDSFNKAAWNITLECTVLSLHVVDRIAGSTLDAAQRSQFMDELLNEVSESVARAILTDKSKSTARNFKDYVVSMYQERSQFYAPLPLGTLYSKAARSIADAYLPKDAGRATLILYTHFTLLHAQLNTLRAGFTAVSGRAS